MAFNCGTHEGMSVLAVSNEGCCLSIVNAAAQLRFEFAARLGNEDFSISSLVALVAGGRVAATERQNVLLAGSDMH